MTVSSWSVRPDINSKFKEAQLVSTVIVLSLSMPSITRFGELILLAKTQLYASVLLSSRHLCVNLFFLTVLNSYARVRTSPYPGVRVSSCFTMSVSSVNASCAAAGIGPKLLRGVYVVFSSVRSGSAII